MIKLKRIIAVISVVIVLFFLVLTFFIIEYKKEKQVFTFKEFKEVRAVFISYIEFDDYIKGKSDEKQKENIREMLDNVKKIGFNTVIVHVRPFSDSVYKSSIYPISNTVLNDKGKYPSYDFLSFFISEAHKRNLRFEAWVNPFRVSNVASLKDVPLDSPYFKFLNSDGSKILDNGIYLNPASESVRDLITDGIKEIVENYDVDGIHFDDYFYPDKTIDLESYDNYKKSGGNLSLDEFRLNNISLLIKSVYTSIKEIKPSVVFGISPSGNIENDYNDCFLDVKKILSSSGYVDYIMPQIYFGFLNSVKPFRKTLDEWNSLIKVNDIELIVALAFYKNGKTDIYAKEGIDEWVNNNDIIKREIEYSRVVSHYKGFSIFSYNYMFNNKNFTENTSFEMKNMLSILD